MPAVTLFLSTLSLRRATYTAICLAPPILFLSTLSLRRATGRGPHSPLVWQISIHALLAESDHGTCIVFLSLLVFLSTLSLRRATRKVFVALIPDKYFYPRSPCGERPQAAQKAAEDAAFLSTLSLRRATIPTLGSHAHPGISIHALLAESDSLRSTLRVSCITFLSTLSLRRATYSRRCRCRAGIHFYPRSPCGERQRPRWLIDFIINISIHALLAESDSSAVRLGSYSSVLFYPRSPCGERRGAVICYLDNIVFYPRSPCGERRKPRALKSRRMVFSIHALLAESDID